MKGSLFTRLGLVAACLIVAACSVAGVASAEPALSLAHLAPTATPELLAAVFDGRLSTADAVSIATMTVAVRINGQAYVADVVKKDAAGAETHRYEVRGGCEGPAEYQFYASSGTIEISERHAPIEVKPAPLQDARAA